MQENKIHIICGVDEAGRGPLAGDVFAAAVILTTKFKLQAAYDKLDIIDSKKLTAKKRSFLFNYITNYINNSKDCFYSIAKASVEEIDKINILQASLLAMQRAIYNVYTACSNVNKYIPNIILVDGKQIPKLDPSIISIPCQALIRGDNLITEISAASILAKVARDEYMMRMHELYPLYYFNKHKGYPTTLHRELLKRYGASPIHRKNFRPVKNIISL